MSFIDLNKFEQEKAIYRYTDFGFLVQMFQKKEMVLVRPEKWDDPFEKYIIDPIVKHQDESFIKLHYKLIIHGSCWTKKSVSDAMWRIYSPYKISVRIKTTPNLLAGALQNALKKYPRSSWYIGKVKYLTQKKIFNKATLLANQILKDNKDLSASSALLFKRNSFSHEQEVRVLIVDRHDISKNGILKLKVDPHKIIQSILVDSRASDEWLQVYSTFLRNELGYKGRISKSTLYNPVEQLVIEQNN